MVSTLPHSSSYFTYEAKPVRGVSTSPRSSSRSPAPSLPRSQAHSSLPTPTPRGPNTGCGPALLQTRCQPQPSPSCPSQHDAGTAGICLLQNTWLWHSLARSGVGAGRGELGWPLWGPSAPIPKAQTSTGTGGPWKGIDCSGRGHSRGHQPVGCSRSFRATAHVCCHAVQLLGALWALLELPWHPECAGAVCLSQSCLATLSQ